MSALSYQQVAGLGTAEEDCPPDTPEVPVFPTGTGGAYSLKFKLDRAVVYARQCRFSESLAEIQWASREIGSLPPHQVGIWVPQIARAQAYLGTVRQLYEVATMVPPTPPGPISEEGTSWDARAALRRAREDMGEKPAAPLPAYLYPGSPAPPSAADQFLSWIGLGPKEGAAPPVAPSARELLRREMAATPPGSVSAQRAAPTLGPPTPTAPAGPTARQQAAAALAKVRAAQAAAAARRPGAPRPVAAPGAALAPARTSASDALRAAIIARQPSLNISSPMAFAPIRPGQAPTVPRWALVLLGAGLIGAVVFWAARRRRRKT